MRESIIHSKDRCRFFMCQFAAILSILTMSGCSSRIDYSTGFLGVHELPTHVAISLRRQMNKVSCTKVTSDSGITIYLRVATYTTGSEKYGYDRIETSPLKKKGLNIKVVYAENHKATNKYVEIDMIDKDIEYIVLNGRIILIEDIKEAGS